MNTPKKNDPKTREADIPGPSKMPATGRETTPPPGPATGPQAQTVLSQPSSRPGTATAGAGDPLKTMMPAGESGSRNPTRNRQATASGGTSGAEDTTRTAGYVADLASNSEAPPGPPVAKDPAMTTRPEKAPDPAPKEARPSPASAAGKTATPPPAKK
jgi:hypothetical protein